MLACFSFQSPQRNCRSLDLLYRRLQADPTCSLHQEWNIDQNYEMEKVAITLFNLFNSVTEMGFHTEVTLKTFIILLNIYLFQINAVVLIFQFMKFKNSEIII